MLIGTVDGSLGRGVLFLHDDSLGPVLSTFMWVVIISTGAWLLVFKTRVLNRFNQVQFEAAICTMLNIMFVFFMAFLGSEFHEDFKNARLSLVKERAAVNRLLHADLPTEALNQKVEAGVKIYLKNVIEVEWREHLNAQESEAVHEAIDGLFQVVLGHIRARTFALFTVHFACV